MNKKEPKFAKKYGEFIVDPKSIGFQDKGWKFVFDNGYGASVIDDGYGKEKGLYELAVIEKSTGENNRYNLCYDTPITNDVLGNLTDEEVQKTLAKIKKFKKFEINLKELYKNPDLEKTLLGSVKMLAQLIKDYRLIFKATELKLEAKMEEIARSFETIPEEQYQELTNMLEQFEQALDDYIKENGIELREREGEEE